MSLGGERGGAGVLWTSSSRQSGWQYEYSRYCLPTSLRTVVGRYEGRGLPFSNTFLPCVLGPQPRPKWAFPPDPGLGRLAFEAFYGGRGSVPVVCFLQAARSWEDSHQGRVAGLATYYRVIQWQVRHSNFTPCDGLDGFPLLLQSCQSGNDLTPLHLRAQPSRRQERQQRHGPWVPLPPTLTPTAQCPETTADLQIRIFPMADIHAREKRAWGPREARIGRRYFTISRSGRGLHATCMFQDPIGGCGEQANKP